MKPSSLLSEASLHDELAWDREERSTAKAIVQLPAAIEHGNMTRRRRAA
jgi:hypothetical protein